MEYLLEKNPIGRYVLFKQVSKLVMIFWRCIVSFVVMLSAHSHHDQSFLVPVAAGPRESGESIRRSLPRPIRDFGYGPRIRGKGHACGSREGGDRVWPPWVHARLTGEARLLLLLLPMQVPVTHLSLCDRPWRACYSLNARPTTANRIDYHLCPDANRPSVQALRGIFFAQTATKRNPFGAPKAKIGHVGVLGAGW